VAIYRQVFAEILPTLTGSDFRARLAEVCAELEDSGFVRLPRGNHLFDRAGSDSLPVWLELIDEALAPEPLPVDPQTYPWPPELRFACDIRDARHLSELLSVQRFLATGGRTRPLVPAKERSVELFGHEKRLEEMRRGSLFGMGRLSLDLLRCFIVRPPLVHERAPMCDHPRPLLIVENHSTYHSFARWNETHAYFAAVIFGSGDSFTTGAAGLADISRGAGWDNRIFYFGDIDVKGLVIPIAAAMTLRAEGLPALLPHLGCYRRAFERALHAHLPITIPTILPNGAQEWLGAELATLAQVWFARGIRIPQELVGWEELLRDGERFANLMDSGQGDGN
jgi:Uncharacterized protein conserved in bacteria C-term(DUF2220)